MKFARINLDQTDYSYMKSSNWKWLNAPDLAMCDKLDSIYKQYCRYKKFSSYMPIFYSEYIDEQSNVIGYYDNEELVAFSLIKKYSNEDVEALQFAWNYANPNLHLGLKSLRHECAVYKSLGFKHLWLGGADEYKKKIDGFEIMGPI
jgi:hypothetical protein